MQFRVAQTPGAAHVAREFNYHSGPLTPEMVHEAARQAKVLDLQKQLRTAYNRHDAKIRANKVELERLTLEAIENGLTDKAQIDKYVSKAIVAGAKHDQHIVNLSQQLQHELGLVKVQGASTKTLQNADLRQRLLLIKANHTSQGTDSAEWFPTKLKSDSSITSASNSNAGEAVGFNNYINAKDFDPIPAVPGGSAVAIVHL